MTLKARRAIRLGLDWLDYFLRPMPAAVRTQTSKPLKVLPCCHSGCVVSVVFIILSGCLESISGGCHFELGGGDEWGGLVWLDFQREERLCEMYAALDQAYACPFYVPTVLSG